MISAEKEVVPFSGKIIPADAKGMVEKWLVQVETIMIQSLKDVTSESIKHYPTVERPEWILRWPGQVVQCVDCIEWTMEVTNAIFQGTLQDQEALCTEQIEQSVKMVQGKLKPNNQVTVEALIVIDVHGECYSREVGSGEFPGHSIVFKLMGTSMCIFHISSLFFVVFLGRDIVKKLKEMRVSSIADFNWISQLRYYWNNFLVRVSMITTDVMYGFEYLGNTGRLVATPLTDRCYRFV